MKSSFLIAAFALAACDPTPTQPEATTPQPRELGTLTAFYPVLDSNGAWQIQLNMTKDTVVIDLAALQAFTADSLGKSIFRSKTEPFFTLDETCLYSNKKPECLAFKETETD